MMRAVSLSTDALPRTDTQSPRPDSPAATRHRRVVWKDPRLVIGIALVAACALAGATLLGSPDPGAAVWTTRTAMAEGQAVDTADLARREVRFTDQAGADRYLPADRPLPEGAVLAHDVGAGELLPRDAVSTRTGPGLVEVPLPLAPTAVPATVRVGASVDVWVTPDPTRSGTADEARLVLRDVPVLHLSRAAGALAAGADRQVIVGVGPDQQDALPTALAATATGTVILTGTR